MVVQHIVFIKFKAGTTEDQIKSLHDQLLTLKTLDGVNNLNCGKNFTTRADFHYGLVVSRTIFVQHLRSSRLNYVTRMPLILTQHMQIMLK